MKIKVTFPSGDVKSFPSGIIVKDIFQSTSFEGKSNSIIATKVNNEITSLSYKIVVNCSIQPVALESREGTNIYRRSLCFLLALTSKELFPNRRLVIGHSLGKGYFYYYDGIDKLAQKDIDKLSCRMREIVFENIPINRRVISYTDAVEYFKNNNQPDTELFLKFRNDSKIPVYECGRFLDLSHGPLVPSTGILKVFELLDYPSGFILRYYSFGKPNKIQSFKDNPLLFSIYKEYKSWGKILKVQCTGALNELIAKGKIKEFIQVAEALHNKKIALIADRIVKQHDNIKIVLIAGPSSSGKTTFAKKLSIQLQVLGLIPVGLSIDNYFLSREETPVDKEGNYDFESLNAIDVNLFNDHLSRLLKGEELEIPQYDFKIGNRKRGGIHLRLPKDGILVCEGIHFLNENLSAQVKKQNKYRIYVSALTQLNLDDHNRVPTTDNRLLRRMVRDHQFRGYTAIETLNMWNSVRRGENKNIFPFQNQADTAFNSALDYELAVLKVYAEPLLKTVKPSSNVYNEAIRLLSFIDNFIPIPSSWVPSESIIREFIGESSFKY